MIGRACGLLRILSATGHTFMHIYPFCMHIGIKGGVFMNIVPTYVFPRNTLTLFFLCFQPVILAVHVLRTYQICIFLSFFVIFDGFRPFFFRSFPFRITLFVTSAQTALSGACRDRFLVVLTNSSLPPKAPDCAINRNRSICAPYTILYIMYARAIQPVTGLDLHFRPGNRMVGPI
jgi:hypothetical protein